ncbi:MAG: acetate/propionate family kinase [Tepidisphaeraceae bacterium]
MLVLVANLGSTSFKFKVLDASKNFSEVARGGYERIGQPGGDFASHADVIDVIVKGLPKPPDAIGFKAVHGGPISGAVRVTDDVIATMQQFADVAPAHNPVYIAAMKSFREKLPSVPQVAAFETAFHQTIPAARQTYAIPFEWTEKLGIRRYGFHGASHRYCSGRVKELVPTARRIINCHLGGSSSVCAVLDGKSVGTSMGLTPQTGLPQNNRVGDFDTFALLKLLKTGLSVDDVLKKLGKESGLLGMSGVSNDMRDIEKAAADGNARATLALDAFADSVRSYIGQYLVALGGIDVLSFSGGIGENGTAMRKAICAGLDFVGLKLDDSKNNVRGREARISAADSRGQIWVVPTNEELVVARQTFEVVGGMQ